MTRSLTATELAGRLGIPRNSLYAWMHHGLSGGIRLRGTILCRRLFVSEDAWRVFVREVRLWEGLGIQRVPLALRRALQVTHPFAAREGTPCESSGGCSVEVGETSRPSGTDGAATGTLSTSMASGGGSSPGSLPPAA